MGDRTPSGQPMSLIPIITTTLSTPRDAKGVAVKSRKRVDSHAIFEQLCAGYSRIQKHRPVRPLLRRIEPRESPAAGD